MQCEAITLLGTQCSRKAEPGSNYCWQHQNYKGTRFTEQKIEKNVEKVIQKAKNIVKSEQKSPIRPIIPSNPVVGPFFDSTEFKRLVEATVPKIGGEEGSDDYKKSKLKNTIIANGPFTIELEVGEYDPTVLKFDLKFGVGNYTFEQVIDKIREFYNRPITHAESFNLLRLSDENEDELSRELFSALQEENGVRLYDYLGSHIYIEGVVYDGLRNLYTLILGS